VTVLLFNFIDYNTPPLPPANDRASVFAFSARSSASFLKESSFSETLSIKSSNLSFRSAALLDIFLRVSDHFSGASKRPVTRPRVNPHNNFEAISIFLNG